MTCNQVNRPSSSDASTTRLQPLRQTHLARTPFAILEKRFFVPRENLARTVMAAKQQDGKIFWLELERTFYHTLVTTALAVYNRNSVQALSCDIKIALFDFLLGVVNGQPQQAFFDGY
jgi:hypothetical protein